MPRSLRVQPTQLDRVKLALQRNGYPSQRALAEEIGLSLATVNNFLTGKPVDFSTFEELSRQLSLEWKEIAHLDFEAKIPQNQSPFNVGLPVQLNTFSKEQVQQLAQRYGLDWEEGEEARQLMDMVEGHPALVQIALYHLSRGEITLAQLLATAPTSTGIYSHHLQRHLITMFGSSLTG
jgi:transcriptional regulator with XRE-family HTH domain